MELPSCSRTFCDLKEGKACARRGNFARAILNFTQVIRALDREVHCGGPHSQPHYARYFEARFERGSAYWQNGQHDQAIEDFSALVNDPMIAKCPEKFVVAAYLRRGINYAALFESSLACADFRRVLERDPKNAEALHWQYVAELTLDEQGRNPHVTLPETLMPTVNGESVRK